jgi:hypothetical protein
MTGGHATAALRLAGTVGTIAALALTAHTAFNIRRLRRPPDRPDPVRERVSVLVPARDEAHRITPTITSLLGQTHLPDLEILVLDDGSTDGTADVVRTVAAGDPRLRVLTGPPPPPGWLGKPHACHGLAEQATGTVLCFTDADVVLAPHAVAGAVTLLRDTGLDLVSPYPRQLADGLGPRLVQPLIEWSWLTTLPLGIAERSLRPSLSAATGQFLVVDAAAYARAGGHTAVAGEVLDDVALLRAVKRSGGHGVPVDGSAVATCRMYDSWDEVRAGYTKSLWSAFGSPAGAAAVAGGLVLVYLTPPLAAVLAGSRVGWLGYAAGVLGRVLVARTTGQPVWPDVLAHPAAIAVFASLTAASLRGRRRGSLTWKGRPVG